MNDKKEVVDRLYNQIMDNAALTNHPPIWNVPICGKCGYPYDINGQHWGETIKADDSAEQ